MFNKIKLSLISVLCVTLTSCLLDDSSESKDGTSCIAQSISEGIEISCGGIVADTLTNGDNGTRGKTGDDGSSCSVTEDEDDADIKIVSCDDGTYITITDGNNGKSGSDGENGIDGDNGEDGKNGKNGKNGDNGEDGEDGKNGEDGNLGEDGTTFLSGIAPPTDYMGEYGDTYLDITEQMYYKKQSEHWKIMNTDTNTSPIVTNLLNVGIDADYLLSAGISVRDLLYGGAGVTDLIEAGVDIEELHTAGVPYKLFKDASVSDKELEQADIIGTVTDSRDNIEYTWARIGTQIWMSENLNYDTESSTCYNNDSEKCNTYGRLYPWAIAMAIDSLVFSDSTIGDPSEDYQGLCPENWHLPSHDEWNILKEYANNAPQFSLTTITSENDTAVVSNSQYSRNTANRLKLASIWNTATNDFNFSAIPGGYRNNSEYDYLGIECNWWSTSESDSTHAYKRTLTSGTSFYGTSISKSYALSVRCIQNVSEE
ncbi:MAG: hypothetical protein OCD01_13770 [Fibrobacterales bacterium]